MALFAFVALLLFAHSPLLRAGLFPWDHAALLDERAAAGRWSLVALLQQALPLPGRNALLWRAEALLLLVSAALAARAFLVRLLAPKIGGQAARAAALVAALILPLNPAATVATAELAGRSEACALLLGLCAGVLFLRGRQEQQVVLTCASFVLLVLAGCASSVGSLFGLLFALAEFAVVRGRRPRSLRLRTAATTALVFCAGAELPRSLAGWTSSAPRPALPLGEELRARSLALAEEFADLACPGVGLGGLDVLVAGVLLLLALQPAIRAARNAPRLWGGMLVCWGAVLLAALLWAGNGANGRALLVLTVWCAGLGLTITALARPRRAVLAAAVALGWALLSHAGARPWLVGSGSMAELHDEILALTPPGARVLVLDPPVVRGLPPLGRELGWSFHSRLGHPAAGSGFDPRRVQGLSRAAFLALTRTQGFERLRRQELVVLVDGRELGGAEEERRAVHVPPPGAAEAVPALWRGDLKYLADVPLDPLEIGFVRLVAELATATREIERLAWRTPAAESARAGDSGACGGSVSERGGRRVAEFDLERSLAWRLAGSVAALLVKNGVRAIERGELLARLPEVPGLQAPVHAGGDWRFREPRQEGGGERGACYVLGLLALDGYELAELPLEPDPAEPGWLRARGAQRFVARNARADAPVAWELEYRIGEHALYRSRGSVP